MKLFFSIIIPVKAINDYVHETVPYIQNLDGDNWELIVIPNEAEDDTWQDSRIRIVPSGSVGPADKRDLGAELAVGNILVFLDDDSYPSKDLLTVASEFFQDKQIAAIGGPAVTPPHDTFWQKVSGAVFLSKYSGGIPERYIPIGNVREIDDWPSVNLMVRTSDFKVAGGFDSEFWPGEDTKFCLDLIQTTGKKIVYVPELIVWHHRRAGLRQHLKQVGSYGLHRGFFAKKYPETSRKLMYFVPSAFLLFATISIGASLYPPAVKALISFGWFAYSIALLLALVDIVKYERLLVGIAALPYVVATHLTYGFNFIRGIFRTNLVSRLR